MPSGRSWSMATARSSAGCRSSRASTARSAHVKKFAVQVPLGTTLRAALGEMLQHDVRWVPVVDEEDRYLGVLTPNRLHAAMRRSVGGTPVES